jgi:hypothetical protein
LGRLFPTAARFLWAAVVLAAPGCGPDSLEPPPDLPAVGGQVSLLRFPREGGPVQAYHPDSLAEPSWTTSAPVPPVRKVLGVNLDERLAWAVDAKNNLIAVDLESRGVREQLTGVTFAAMGADGSLYLADEDRRVVHFVRRTPVSFQEALPSAPRAFFGAQNDLLVAVTGGRTPQLITANAEQGLNLVEIPAGQTTATYWGDLVAVATDTAVVLYETSGRHAITSIRTRQAAREAAFSPSGHRLYVAEEDDEVLVYDRFSLKEVAKVSLPGIPRAIRVDASGRWLLARASTADSIWIVDLATHKMAATSPGEWAADLPLVAGASTLVVRQGNDVTTWDLRQVPPALQGSLEGAGEDIWVAAAWVPRDRMPAAVAAAESATVVQDSALVADSTVAQTVDSTDIYLQVSLSQNSEWAAQLANQLKADGFAASVLQPTQPEEGYRVVIGPYATRELAEEGGKKLGRSYFIIRRPPRRP